jgi:MerR family transcriptional regulator, heat shock protein HspR
MPRRTTREEGRRTYMISAVSQRYGVHPQTLRLYERDGLLKPSRTDGNTRYYTDEDLERLEVILNLTRNLGVNLAGVDIVLNMRDKMGTLQEQLNAFIEFFFDQMERAGVSREEARRQAIVKVPARSVQIILDRMEKGHDPSG